MLFSPGLAQQNSLMDPANGLGSSKPTPAPLAPLANKSLAPLTALAPLNASSAKLQPLGPVKALPLPTATAATATPQGGSTKESDKTQDVAGEYA